MLLYRIAAERFARDLDGEGARLFGGRWNPVGVPMVYASESVAVAALEVLANLPMHIPVPNYRVVTFRLPEPVSLTTLKGNELPGGWDHYPPSSALEVGKRWGASCATLALRVPTAVLHGHGWNWLLNPLHPEMRSVEIVGDQPFAFDPRLLR